MNQPVPDYANFTSRLSVDGTKIAWHDWKQDLEQLVIDDLQTQKRTSYPWNDSWDYIYGWTEDGRVIIYIDGARDDTGVTKQLVYFNLRTLVIQEVTDRLDLPDFTFMDNNPYLGSYAVDPSGQLVFYTALDDTLTEYVILREIATGRELWKLSANNNGAFIVPPKWTSDGRWVIFNLFKDGDEYIKIFRLSRDGTQFVELTHQPLDKKYKNYLLRDLDVSPDGRYIYFAQWYTVSDGPGYILDTTTLEIREICTPGRIMMWGWFLQTGNQLLYFVRPGEYFQDDNRNPSN